MQKQKKTAKGAARWLRIENDKFYLNSEKTAAFFDVTDRTIRDWDDKAGGILKLARGWWDIKAIMEWRSGANDESDAARKLRAEADLKEKQAKKAEFEYAIMLEEYFPRKEVVNEWVERLLGLKNSLLALSKKIGSNISDPVLRIEIEEMVTEEVLDYLGQYSRIGRYTPSHRTRERKRG